VSAATRASPIKIAGTGREGPTRIVIAHSAPNPSTQIPKAPTSRPKVPQRDPPVMMLPPSPPVCIPAGALASQPRFVSDWTSVLSSSCPNTNYLDMMASKWSLMPHEPEEPDVDFTKLSQSPTIFSLLQGNLPALSFRVADKAFVPSSRSVPKPNAPVVEKAFVLSSRGATKPDVGASKDGNSLTTPDKGPVTSVRAASAPKPAPTEKEQKRSPDDEMMFSMSLDDNSDSGTDATQYLSFDP